MVSVKGMLIIYETSQQRKSKCVHVYVWDSGLKGTMNPPTTHPPPPSMFDRVSPLYLPSFRLNPHALREDRGDRERCRVIQTDRWMLPTQNSWMDMSRWDWPLRLQLSFERFRGGQSYVWMRVCSSQGRDWKVCVRGSQGVIRALRLEKLSLDHDLDEGSMEEAWEHSWNCRWEEFLLTSQMD